jgi:hypothetical protein
MLPVVDTLSGHSARELKDKISNVLEEYEIRQHGEASVAKGPKFRLQTTKGAEKNCVGTGKSAAELLANLSKRGQTFFVVWFGTSHIFRRKLYLPITILKFSQLFCIVNL